MRWCGDRPCAARLSVPSLATLRHHHARAQNLACGVLEGTPAAEADEPIEPIDTAGLVSKLADATTDEPASIDQLQMPARQTPAVAKAAQAGQQGQSAALGSARARLLRLRMTRRAAPGDSRHLGERRGHWAPCRGRPADASGARASRLQSRPFRRLLTIQAGRVLVSEIMSEGGPPHDAQMQETAAPDGEQAGEPGGGCAVPPKTRKQRRS